MSGFEVRAATVADAPGIRRLFERIFKTVLTEEEWRWKFAEDPDGWHGVVGVLDGEGVGNYAGWGMRFLLDGAPRLLYSVGDVATNPSVRALGGRRGIYRAMTDVFYEAVGRRVPFCFGFPNARALKVSERIVGSRTLFPIAVKRTPVEAFGPPPRDAGSGESVDEAFDPLWEAARRYHARGGARPCARELAVLRAAEPLLPDGLAAAGRELAAWAALSVVGEEATVVDFLGREGTGAISRRSSPRPPTRPAPRRPAPASGRRRPDRAAARSRRCPARAPTRVSR